MKDAIQRFSSKVELYAKYRPKYPNSIIKVLNQECNLTSSSIIADIGSGTGMLTELFLRNGNHVFGIEPNKDMREAGERLLNGYSFFTSIAGYAEATTLPDNSVDFATVGQAFHWFNHEQSRSEFARILKPHGWVILVWIIRHTTADSFMTEYERLVQIYSSDYKELRRCWVDSTAINEFFKPETYSFHPFKINQVMNLEDLKGRLLSSSHIPGPNDPAYNEMLEGVEAIFNSYQVNGSVAFKYETNLYYGRLPH